MVLERLVQKILKTSQIDCQNAFRKSLTLPLLILQCDTDDDLRTPSSGSLRRTSTRRADSTQSLTPTDTPASIGKATKPKNAKKAAAVQTATSDDTEDDDTTPPGKISINDMNYVLTSLLINFLTNL